MSTYGSYGSFGAMTPCGRWLPYGLNATEGMGALGAADPVDAEEAKFDAIQAEFDAANAWVIKKGLQTDPLAKKMNEATARFAATVYEDTDLSAAAYADWKAYYSQLRKQTDKLRVWKWVFVGVGAAALLSGAVALQVKATKRRRARR